MPATTPRPCSSRRRLTLVAAASLAISIATTACGHLNAPESRVDTSESTSTAVAVEVDSAAVPPTRTPTRPRPPAPTPRPTRTRAPTRAPAPTPTPVPTWTPVALPPESPVDGLSGRIVWHNRLGTVYEMDLSARTHRKLWSESGHVRDLAVAPGGLEAAYVVARTPAEESVVIRALEPEASGRVVATDVNTATTLTRPAWSPDGADVVFGVFGEDNLFTESFDHCAFHAIARDGSAERTLWSGSTADFPRSFGCPWQFLWEPVSGRLAAFEHCFECPMSVHLDLLDTGASGVAQRIDVLADDQGAAPSPDRVWVAWVESSAYYGEMASRPVWEALNWDLDVESDRWPGRAHVRSLNLVNGGTLDIMSAETAVGFTSPLWAPDGTWLAFAEPLGAVTTPIPPSDDSRPTFAGTGTRLWAVTRDGDVRMKLDLDGLNAWPVAISPDGTFVLVAAGAGLQPTLRLVAYRVADGAGGLVATLGVMDADVAWVR